MPLLCLVPSFQNVENKNIMNHKKKQTFALMECELHKVNNNPLVATDMITTLEQF